MQNAIPSRRSFIIGVSLCLGGSLTGIGSRFPFSAALAVYSEADFHRALVPLARTLFPHRGLADPVYATVLSQAAEALAPELDAAAAALHAASGGRWDALGPEERVEVLRGLEAAGWFAPVREAVRAGVYLGAPFADLIGYEGSSKEYGGYLERGAGAIDWLPGSGA